MFHRLLYRGFFICTILLFFYFFDVTNIDREQKLLDILIFVDPEADIAFFPSVCYTENLRRLFVTVHFCQLLKIFIIEFLKSATSVHSSASYQLHPGIPLNEHQFSYGRTQSIRRLVVNSYIFSWKPEYPVVSIL